MSNTLQLTALELTPGTLSIGFHVPGTDILQLLEDWENLDYVRAATILGSIKRGTISAVDLADKPYREVLVMGFFTKRGM